MTSIVFSPLSSPLLPQLILCPHLYCLSIVVCTIALCILSVIAVQMFNIHVFVSGCIVLNRHPCIKESTGLSFAELSSDSVRCCSSCFNRVARLINSHQTNEQQVSLLSEASDGLYSSLLLLLHLDKTSIWPH